MTQNEKFFLGSKFSKPTFFMNKYIKLIACMLCVASLSSCASFWKSDIESKVPYIRTASFIISRNALANSHYSEKSKRMVEKISTALNTIAASDPVLPDGFLLELSQDKEVNSSLSTLIEGIYLLYKEEFDKIKDGQYKNLPIIVSAIAEGVELSVK
jgi:hypothetical protein